MTSKEDTFVRLSRLAKQNHQFTNQATRILKGLERRLKTSNPGIEVVLEEPIHQTNPIWRDKQDDEGDGTWERARYRIGWVKITGVMGWSLVALLRVYRHDGKETDADRLTEAGWYPIHPMDQTFEIDSWPAALRVEALRHLDKLTQELLERVETQIIDREKAVNLIEEHSYLAEFDDREKEGDQ